MRPQTLVRVYKDGETHELGLWWHASCVDCRFNDATRCKLFGVASGMRPAVCLAAEGEATARRNAELKQIDAYLSQA
jgi:hypothetical protein